MNEQIKDLATQAQELATKLLNTEFGDAYTSARQTFEANPDAMVILQNYGEKVQEYQTKSQTCQDEAELEASQAELTELVAIMQQNQDIANFFQAEEQFHRFVARIMDVFNATLIGQSVSMEEEGCGCSGGCCGGQHEESDCGSGGCCGC